jgi:peptidase inhibitor family I36
MTRAVAAALMVSGLLGVPSMAAAQYSWGHAEEPKSGACFYKDPEFRGDYFCVRDGESERDMPRHMNDRISSIRLFGNASVTVFQDSRFEGRSSRFDYDVPDLKHEGWNDLISSFRVAGGWGHHHGGFGGGHHGDADAIVRRAYEDVLNREPDAEGLRAYRRHLIDDGWTEQQVRQSLRESPEYREQNTMTYTKAREIVRQAYLNVLHREPDSGAGGYINNVLTKQWNQGDVERELRKSPEYRNRR